MIQLDFSSLSNEANAKLATYQVAIDLLPTYDERIEKAKSSFSLYNKIGNTTFDEVKKTLNALACGAERCHYCEDSKADEVEHIHPKTWYTDMCFVWENYCYACGPCNGPKSNRFAVINPVDDTLLEFPKRVAGVTALPPPVGLVALINPRFENPLAFIFLDIQGETFMFTADGDIGTIEHQRAHYTINLLGLNSRAYLPKARKNAYGNFFARLSFYQAEKQKTTPSQLTLDNIKQGILEEQHQTVWQEMKRQHLHIPKLKALFVDVPEALTW